MDNISNRNQNNPAPVRYFIHHRSEAETNNLCIFSSYSFNTNVAEYVFYYLDKLKQAGFSIAFVSTSELKTECVEKLSRYAFLIINRENKCPDFGSWKIALDELNLGRDFNAVLLANDSVFGPVCDLPPILETMNKRYDVWGMTGSNEIDYHIQSYFLHFSKKAILSDQWTGFWQSVNLDLTKQEVINKYEIGFTRGFMKAGLKVGSYADVEVLSKSYGSGEKYFNPTLRFWKVLIEKFDFPFFKREVLIREDIDKVYWAKGIYLNIGNWRKLLSERTKYPVEHIDNFLKEYYQSIKEKNRSLVLEKRKIIFLAHNLEIGGAQRVLLNFLKWFGKHTNTSFEIIACLGGKAQLLDEFQKLGNVTLFYNLNDLQKLELKERLANENISMVFSNTMVNTEVMKFLSFLDVPQIVFVHELTYVLNFFSSVTSNIEWLRNNVSHFICCAEVVRQNLTKFLEIEDDKTSVVHEFIEDESPEIDYPLIKSIKEELHIPSNAFIVGMCGTFEWRKAADLLPVIASSVCRPDNDIHLMWVGADKDVPLYKDIVTEISKAGLNKRVHLIPKVKNGHNYFSMFDVFVMPSREDPFPLVNLESGMAGKPTICFQGSGGSVEYVETGAGVAVPYLDIAALGNQILYYYNNRAELDVAKRTIPSIVKNNFTSSVQSPKLYNVVKRFYDENELMIVDRPAVTYMTHIYYDNSWEELKAKLKQFDNGRNNFFFSVSEACLTKDIIVKDIRESFGNSFCLITSNIGKDIGGKLALIDIYLLLQVKSSYIVFIHDKQSPQTLVGEAWKNNLHKIIDPLITKDILGIFKDSKIGIVGAREHIINEYDERKGEFRHNNDLSKKLLAAYKLSPKNYDYLSGTMYWLRASVIEDFFTEHNPIKIREKLEVGNVLDNNGDTFAHTWERMFCWISASKGYSLKGI